MARSLLLTLAILGLLAPATVQAQSVESPILEDAVGDLAMDVQGSQPSSPPGDWKALDDLPKNSSRVRLKNRCQMSGRPRGYVRYFGISRVALRDMALNGKIPGLKKASW